ncbi:MAG: cytochrome c family protein [Candidatus Polarisedimenticolaceae bacterium]|nr:cytochrome c family protein [Candidatus Polarisedimenticolaceae bacterium]
MYRWHLFNTVLCISLLLLLSQSVMAQPKFIGNVKCASCHKVEFASWELSAHGKAFNILKPGKRKVAKRLADLDPEKDYTHEKKCMKCHVTGYRKKGGFKSIEATPEMAGVGCESCHGPGGEYKTLHEENLYGFKKNQAEPLGQLYGEDDESVCRACHGHEDAPHNESLDPKYKYDWKASLKKQDTYHAKKRGRSQFSF